MQGTRPTSAGIAAALTLAGVLALMANPAAALGADLYVDAETGSNANPCSQGAPCQSITQALTASGAADTIRIDSGSYSEQLTLANGRSLDFQDFVAADGASPAVIDGGATTAVTVVEGGAGKISDLVLRGDVNGVQLNGAAEVAGNTFDEPGADNAFGVNAALNISGISIHDNTFTDPAPGATRGRVGIQAQNTDSEIRDNEFSDLNIGILSSPGTGASVIEGNEFTGTHNLPGQGRSIGTGGGAGGTVTIRENTLSDAETDEVVYGIILNGAATLVRNEVSGHTIGVLVPADVTGVTLEGDRLYDGAGLQVSDLNATPPRAEATLTNVTVADAAIFNDGAKLTIDSSIVEGVSANASASCTITFSRGDSTAGTDPTGCDDFTTDADPQLVNAGAGNLHLSPGSPMIDAGNPATPPLGAVDFDGDLRALDATPECSGNVDRRDIGADEWAPVSPDCDPPETTLTKTPKKKIEKKQAKFEFESDEPVGGSFMCKLDGAPYATCDSPLVWPVKVGRHTFRVYAVDAGANEDATAAEYRFKRRRR